MIVIWDSQIKIVYLRCNSETEILIIKNLKIMRKKFENQVVDFIVTTTDTIAKEVESLNIL